VGLEPSMKSRYPHEFSGGQRQRISIARAMILKPSLIVLDEPTSALDCSVQSQVIELLKNLQLRHRTSFIFISHDLRVVRAVAHRILVMKAGRVVEMGETHQIFSRPRDAYTQALIKASFLNE
jgi:microcin C transport system ATP-binding protein